MTDQNITDQKNKIDAEKIVGDLKKIMREERINEIMIGQYMATLQKNRSYRYLNYKTFAQMVSAEFNGMSARNANRYISKYSLSTIYPAYVDVIGGAPAQICDIMYSIIHDDRKDIVDDVIATIDKVSVKDALALQQKGRKSDEPLSTERVVFGLTPEKMLEFEEHEKIIMEAFGLTSRADVVLNAMRSLAVEAHAARNQMINNNQ